MSDSFFSELRRRNVFKVGTAYIVLAWVVIQVTSEAVPALRLPEWVNSLVFLLGAIGFPFALFFAWAFELTPEGIKREADVVREESITTNTGQKLNYIIIALLAVALAYFIYERQSMQPVSEQPLELTEQSEAVPADARPSIAVLPLTNMSGDDANLPFTMGIHDDLLTHISRIKALKTTSRTSVLQYAGTTKTIPQIGEELGVTSILEGSIQRAGNQVRINMQLIDTRTDEHIWADIFNRELTTENLFEVQGEIAQAVTDALKVALLPEEKAAITSAPTTSMESYDLYLLGRHEWNQRTPQSLTKARNYFEQALAADPDFVLAMSGLADSYIMLSSYGVMSGDEALPKAKEQIDRAMLLDDSVSEVWASLGSYFTSRIKPIEAEKAFKRAIELDDKNAMAWLWYGGFLGRNDVRRYEERLAAYQKAFALEPMHKAINRNLSIIYNSMGNFDKATEHAMNVIAVDDDRAQEYELANAARNIEAGNIAKAIYDYREILAKDPSSSIALRRLTDCYLILGDLETAMIWAKRADEQDIRAGAVNTVFTDMGDYQAAIENIQKTAEMTGDRANFNYIGGLLFNYALMGDMETATVLFNQLVAGLGNNIKAMPFDWDPLRTLYFSYFWSVNGDEDEKERGLQLARDVIEATRTLIDQGFHHPDTYFGIAFAHFLIDDKQSAYEYLDMAIDKGYRSQFGLRFINQIGDLSQDKSFILRDEQLSSYAAIETAKLEKMSLADYIPLRRVAIDLDQNTLAQYIGYFSDGNAIWHFYFNEQAEFMMTMGQRRIEKLIPIAVNEFYPELEVDVTYEFVADDSGEISHVLLNDDSQVRLKRVSSPPAYINLPISTLKKYEGTYSYYSMPDDRDNPQSVSWTGTIKVNDKGEVWFDPNNQPALILQPTARDEFDMPGFLSRMKFFFDDGPERPSHLIAYFDGRELRFERED